MKISPQSEPQSKLTKTSLFLKFLINICFLPITFKENDGTVRFKWMSRKTLVHIFIYGGGYVFCCILVHLVDKDIMEKISEQNVIESLSISSGSITIVAIIFPLVLGAQFHQTDLKMLWAEQLSFPKQGLRGVVRENIYYIKYQKLKNSNHYFVLPLLKEPSSLLSASTSGLILVLRDFSSSITSVCRLLSKYK